MIDLNEVVVVYLWVLYALSTLAVIVLVLRDLDTRSSLQ